MTSNKKERQAELRKEDEAKLKALREALIEGEESGEPTPFDFDEFLRQVHEKSKREK